MVWRLAYVMLASSQQGTQQLPRSPKDFLYPIGLATENRHPKRDHDLVECSAVLLSFSTRTYMVGSIHFLVLWRIYTAFLFGFSFTHDWCSQVVWLGVTGVRYLCASALSLRRWCILKDGWQ